MKKIFYLFLATLTLTSCTESLEPWEKDPLHVDIRFVIESDQDRSSIIMADINDGSNGAIDISTKEEKPDNLPFEKEYINQKVNFYTQAALSYQDRSTVKIGDEFSEYTITLKMFVDGELKKEEVFLMKEADDIQFISYDFEELFFD